jgi:hypothetical protein
MLPSIPLIASGLGVLFDIRWTRSIGVVACSEVALVKRTNLVIAECADDRVQDATVMKQHEVFLRPVVRVDELHVKANQISH